MTADATRWGCHEVFPVPVTRGTREEFQQPEDKHEDFVAFKCENCGLRTEGHELGVDATLQDTPCLPSKPYIGKHPNDTEDGD